jgi:hypothetical protein
MRKVLAIYLRYYSNLLNNYLSKKIKLIEKSEFNYLINILTRFSHG